MTRDLDLEDIAAFAEGTLSAPERERVLARLAASDEDAGLLADAAAVLRELEAEDGIVAVDEDGDGAADAEAAPGGEAPVSGTPVTPLRPPSTARRGWRRAPARWLALAAVLAGVLLVPLALSRRGGDPGDPGRLVALLENRAAGLPAGYDQRPWSVTRGAADPVTDQGRAARLGALLVDLEVAAAARQAEETRNLALRIRTSLEDVPAAGPQAAIFAEIEQRAGQDPEQLEELLKEGRTNLAAMLPPDHFALGAWAEAARIAAVRKDAEFFSAAQSHALLKRAAAGVRPDDPVAWLVEQIRQVTNAGSPPEWPVLERLIHELLRAAAS